MQVRAKADIELHVPTQSKHSCSRSNSKQRAHSSQQESKAPYLRSSVLELCEPGLEQLVFFLECRMRHIVALYQQGTRRRGAPRVDQDGDQHVDYRISSSEVHHPIARSGCSSSSTRSPTCCASAFLARSLLDFPPILRMASL